MCFHVHTRTIRTAGEPCGAHIERVADRSLQFRSRRRIVSIGRVARIGAREVSGTRGMRHEAGELTILRLMRDADGSMPEPILRHDREIGRVGAR